MNGLQDLPVILRWELSLAVLVLVWSLVSLGRASDWMGRLRRRKPVPRNVVQLPRARREPVAGGRPLRALAVALAFAVLATGFAYALPDVIRIAPSEGGGMGKARNERRTEPGPRPAGQPSVTTFDERRSGAADDTAPAPSRGRGHEPVRAGEVVVDASDEPRKEGTEPLEEDDTVTAASPTPQPSAGSPEPTPTPSPSDSPSPEPTVTEATPAS